VRRHRIGDASLPFAEFAQQLQGGRARSLSIQAVGQRLPDPLGAIQIAKPQGDRQLRLIESAAVRTA